MQTTNEVSVNNTYGGLILVFDETQRAKKLEQTAELEGRFTEAVSGADWKLDQLEVCLLSFDNKHISAASLGRRVVTYKISVAFTDFVKFEPLNLQVLNQEVDQQLDNYFTRSSTGELRRVPVQVWNALIAAIKSLRPTNAEMLDKLEMTRLATQDQPNYEWLSIWEEERDAVQLALEIAGFERNVEVPTSARTAPDDRAPFLSGLKSAIMREDAMINNDTSVFGDWVRKENYQVNAVLFKRNGQSLTVTNVNRTPIETALGVDLIYYHHAYNSFVLVQYKRLSKDEYGKYCYRPNNDASYTKELERMCKFSDDHIKLQPAVNLDNDFRFGNTPFYFKLCKSRSTEPLSTDLIQGMYLSLDYWQLLLQSPQILGRNGGTVISYDNVPRHLNNTLFVSLVQDGWIGSRKVASEVLTIL